MRGWLGRALYRLNLPLIRRILNGSRRVRVILFNHNQSRVLLVKNLLGLQRWSLPGGGIKTGESPAQAASRELKEELGLDLNEGDFELIDNFDHAEPAARSDWRAYIVVCRIPLGTRLKSRRTELLDHGWFGMDKLPEDTAGLTADVISAFDRTTVA